MKKKRLWIIAVMAILLAVSAVGCGNDKEEQLEQEVDRLEQQINDLQEENDLQKQKDLQTEKEFQTEKDLQKETDSVTSEMTEGTTNNETQKMSDYTELESAVNAQVEKTAAAVADSDESKKVEQYFALKREIEELDQKLDVHDDYLESQYRQKSLTFEELKNQERDLDMLENKLDDAEDQLEIRFGMDD